MTRQHHIDGLRGLAVLLMVMVHIAATWNPYSTAQTGVLAYTVSGLGGLAAPLFVTVFGWSAALRPLSFSQRIVRALVLFGLQIAVNLSAPHLFEPLTPGVLSLFGLLMLFQPVWLAPLDSKHRSFATIAILLVTVVVVWGSPSWMGSTDWAQRVAVGTPTDLALHLLVSGTYPLFPWFFFAMFGGYLQRSTVEHVNLVLSGTTGVGVSVSAVLLVASWRTATPWALPSGEAYLTFFPTNGPFLLAALAGVSILWSACLRYKVTAASLAPIGRVSLTVYVGHFLPLAYVHMWDSRWGWSLTFSIMAALTYTVAWGLLALQWFRHRPTWTLERIMRRLESVVVRP